MATPLLISSIAKLAMCNPWSRSASNYSEIFSDNNGRGTLCPSDIGNKWNANVSVARMNDVLHFEQGRCERHNR